LKRLNFCCSTHESTHLHLF